MALKLFRSTGYTTLLEPGETRFALHPAWVVVLVSAWVAVADNVALWRLLLQQDATFRMAALEAALTGGTSLVLLSLLAWRRTLKAAATLVLLVAVLLACGLWAQQLPVEALWTQRPRALLPSWATFMRGQVLLIVLAAAILPIVLVWQLPLRRLPAQSVLRIAAAGLAAGAVLVAASFAGAAFTSG